MRKYIAIFVMFMAFALSFMQQTFAEGIFKITSANYDTSSAIISLTSSNITDLPDIKEIKVIKLSNPTRLYFDLTSSALGGTKKDWQFNSEGIKRVQISQFSTNPHIVRVVINYDNNYDISNMRFYKIQNSIIIKFKNTIAQNPFMQNTYRDDHASSSDFYEYMTVNSAVSVNDKIAEINSAFNNSVNPLQKQELRLNTKYYVDKVIPKNGAVFIGGIGAAAIEKPMILSNPMRIVFDIPNALVNYDIRNKEYNLGGSDKFKIGQFSVNKARIVITTPDVTKYIPVYSRDNQSIMFANTDKINVLSLPPADVTAKSFSNNKIDSQTSAMTLNFDKSIVHGLDRTNSEVVVYLYNVNSFDEDAFNKTFTNTQFSSSTLKNGTRGLKLTIPIAHDSLVLSFLSADGKSLKIQVKAPKAEKETPSVMNPSSSALSSGPAAQKGSKIKRKVVIDAGHGGSDVGAIRNGVYEKYITLDVAKRVEKLLKEQGYEVLMTRTNDTFVSLADRVECSENYHPDIFVSIHVNSSTSDSIKGIETHYYHQESIPLAQTVHASLASAVNSPNRGLFKSKFYVINHTTVPAILVEIGFISNTAERGQLVSEARKQATAKAIVEGINNYFKNK